MLRGYFQSEDEDDGAVGAKSSDSSGLTKTAVASGVEGGGGDGGGGSWVQSVTALPLGRPSGPGEFEPASGTSGGTGGGAVVSYFSAVEQWRQDLLRGLPPRTYRPCAQQYVGKSQSCMVTGGFYSVPSAGGPAANGEDTAHAASTIDTASAKLISEKEWLRHACGLWQGLQDALTDASSTFGRYSNCVMSTY